MSLPAIPPTPAPLQTLSNTHAQQTARLHASEVAALHEKVRSLQTYVLVAAALLAVACVGFVRAGTQRVRDPYAHVYEPVRRTEPDTDFRSRNQGRPPQSPSVRKRSTRVNSIGV